MKVICTQENLAKGVSLVSRSIGKDVNLPVLANILLEAKKGTVKISATDLEIGTTCFIRGKIEKEGAITIPAHLLQNYIASLPRTTIELIVEKNVLKIKCDNYFGEINGISASEFPLIPKIECKPFCKVKAEFLLNALEKIVFAAAKEEMRPEISGVFLTIDNKRLRLAATDSYRLGEVVIDCIEFLNKEIALIVPTFTMQELMHILSEGAEEVTMFLMENQIKFEANGVTLISRLIEGQYPDYRKIIPKEFTTTLEIHKENFIKAIKTTSLFSKIDTNELIVNTLSSKKTIELSAESGRVGKNISSLSCGFFGQDVKIIFNSRYLIEGLSSLTSDVVLVKLLGNSGPGLIVGKNEKDHFYIVMPIKK